MISVLYVDDEQGLLDLAKIFLEDEGEFRVEIATSARKVLDAPSAPSYDAIVSDYQMPVMDGIAFLKIVRERFGKVPFILFTGRGREEVVMDALNNGADFYLQKGGEPTSQFAELSNKIRYAVARRQAETELQRKNDELNASYEQIAANEEELRQQLEELSEKQEALKHSEEKFRAFTENIPDLTTIVDMTGVYTYVSPSIQRITGWRADSLLEKPFAGIDSLFGLLPEDKEILLAGGRLAMQRPGDAIPVLPFRVRGATGETRFIEGTMTYLPGVPGIRGILFHGRDITDRIRAEEALRKKNEELNASFEQITAADEEMRGQYEELAYSEKQIRESEVKFRGIFEKIHDALILFTKDGCVDCNQRALELYGFTTKDEMYGHLPADVAPPVQPDGQDSRALAEAHIRTVLEKGFDHFEWLHKRKDGSTFSADILLSGFELDGTQVFVSSVRDITERREREDLLQLLKISVDRSSDEVFWMDFDGSITYVNDAACQTTGYSRDELLAMKISELDPNVSLPLWEESVADLRTRKTQFITTRHRCKNGTIIDVEIVAVYVTKDNREYSFAFVRDITGRKQNEAALRESEEKYRTLIENVREAIAIVQDWNIVFVNSRGAHILGLPGEEIHGRPFMDFIWPDDRKMIQDLHRGRESGEAVADAYDFRVTGPGGRPVWVLMSAAQISWLGRPATLSLMTDITERKTLEQAVSEANKKLNLLFSITRHDVANQLTMLQGYVQIAERKNTDPVVADFLVRIEQSADTIDHQIAFTKAYHELGVQLPGWFRLDALISSAGGPVIKQSKACMNLEIFSDPMIERVFFNLGENARQHGGHVTEIRVGCEQSPDGLVITVEDNGAGVAPGEKERIFEKGYGKNTGFGLFLAREILAITEITIRETGVPGTGARFEITVPKGMWRIAAGNQETG